MLVWFAFSDEKEEWAAQGQVDQSAARSLHSRGAGPLIQLLKLKKFLDVRLAQIRFMFFH